MFGKALETFAGRTRVSANHYYYITGALTPLLLLRLMIISFLKEKKYIKFNFKQFIGEWVSFPFVKDIAVEVIGSSCSPSGEQRRQILLRPQSFLAVLPLPFLLPCSSLPPTSLQSVSLGGLGQDPTCGVHGATLS